MEKLLKRLSYFIADILLYSDKVTSVSRPVFKDVIYLQVRIQDVPKTLILPYNIVSMNEEEYSKWCINYAHKEGLV